MKSNTEPNQGAETANSLQPWNPELGRVVRGVKEYSSPKMSVMLSSSTMQPRETKWRMLENKGVHQASIEDLKLCLAEMKSILSDLDHVAYFHPEDGVAQFAQVILADAAGLVLRTWPADADKSVKPGFQNLYVMEGGAFRTRWDREHKSGQRKPGDSKRDFLHALLFFKVWPLYQTNSHDVIKDTCGLHSVNFEKHPFPGYYNLDFVRNLRSFYESAPGLISDCQKNPDDVIRLSWRALLVHFDLFWDLVMDPCIFAGKPSLWEKHSEGAFNGSKSPSKHRPQLKRLLLKMLRSSLPDVIVKTSVDG